MSMALKKQEKNLMRILARQCMQDREIKIKNDNTTPQDYQGILSFMRKYIQFYGIPRYCCREMIFAFHNYAVFLGLLGLYKETQKMKIYRRFDFFRYFLTAIDGIVSATLISHREYYLKPHAMAMKMIKEALENDKYR